MKKFAFIAIMALIVTGCMSDKEYQLRSKQLANQAAHPTTFEVFTATGPMTIDLKENSKVAITAPNQPFKEVAIPDGIKTQEQLIAHLVDIGAISILGWKALDDAGGTTKNITNNYGTAAGE